jgi:hypothetical protein
MLSKSLVDILLSAAFRSHAVMSRNHIHKFSSLAKSLSHVYVQEDVTARATASLISLISNQILNAHSLQDIEFTFVNTDDGDDDSEPIDYYALVKDAAELAPSSTCNGNSIRNRMIVKVSISTLPIVLGVLHSKTVLMTVW